MQKKRLAMALIVACTLMVLLIKRCDLRKTQMDFPGTRGLVFPIQPASTSTATTSGTGLRDGAGDHSQSTRSSVGHSSSTTSGSSGRADTIASTGTLITSVPSTVLPSSTTIPPTFVVPGQEGMHRELIPKNISIVRCYYDLDVMAPGTTFGFDINGSGFDDAFYRIITVDADALDVSVKNLRLVTANQIHGQIEVGTDATTQYVNPKVYIRGLPVFRAPDPFGVVRRGEVLDIQLTSIDDSGQWGRFRVITNLDDALYSRFRIEPTNPKLEVSNLKTEFPFYVNGVIMIGMGLSRGQYGITTMMGKRELMRKDPIVDVVKPNVGRTGSIERVSATEVAHRPGDVLELTVKGSGFLPNVPGILSLAVKEFDMGASSFTYLSPGKLQATLRIPTNAPKGVYGVTISANGKELYEQASVFGIVPPNWLTGVKLQQPIKAGQSGILQIVGRDLDPAFVQSLQLAVDEPGIRVSNLRIQTPSFLIADIHVSTGTAPGDYIVHVMANGKDLKLPKGNLIKVNE